MTRRTTPRDAPSRQSSNLMVRLDEESKAALAGAAKLRGVSVSDYVRTVTISQAQREVKAAREKLIVLTADEQLQFWNALCERPRLTAAQKRLSAIMRGQA